VRSGGNAVAVYGALSLYEVTGFRVEYGDVVVTTLLVLLLVVLVLVFVGLLVLDELLGVAFLSMPT
jgi:hypothetical protein